MFIIAVYLFAVVGVICVALEGTYQGLQLLGRHKAGSHKEVMRRIALLELEAGVGVDYAKEWIDTTEPICVSGKQYAFIGEYKCILCGTEFTRNGVSLKSAKFCPTHRKMAFNNKLTW